MGAKKHNLLKENQNMDKEKVKEAINAQIKRMKEHVNENNFVKSDVRLYRSMRYIIMELQELLEDLD